MIKNLPAGIIDPAILPLEEVAMALGLHMAMANELAIEFDYDGKHRVVEVHAFGTSAKDGKLILRGFQVAGEASRPLPQWTLFSFSKMDNVHITDIASQAPREGYTMGDAHMTHILSQFEL